MGLTPCEQSAARTLEYPESSADQCVRSYMDLKEKAAGNIVDGWNFPKVGGFSRLGTSPAWHLSHLAPLPHLSARSHSALPHSALSHVTLFHFALARSALSLLLSCPTSPSLCSVLSR